MISRRTLLKGAGVTMALPWLEAWGAAAAPPRRFAALFMGNGINQKHWWAKGSRRWSWGRAWSPSRRCGRG
jgi:hypothetical protein